MKKHEDEKVIDGKTAFMLYYTYGFPYELTVEIAEEKGFTVDEEGFHEEMKAQQERARAARGDLESFASQKADLMDFEEPSTFNYDPSPIDGKVIALFKNGEKVEEITDEGEIIFDQTTFYAEMGGQVADKGTFANDQVEGEVVNVLKAPNGQHLHYVKVNGSVKVGDVFTLEVDTAKRVLIENNHTATHLLDAALKEILGEHVAQAGSYVDEKGLRFDFTHPSKMSEEEIKKVEELVNMKIFAGIPVEISEMKKEDALKAGATALFDEKYGDVVRVVKASDFSVELCGGCHAPNTGRIGLFKINVESSVGSGIRRIEAVTSSEAYKAMMAEKETVNAVAATLKLKNRAQVVEKVADLVDENAALRKEIEKLNGQLNALQAKSKASDVEEVNGVRFLYEHVEKNAKDAKQLVFDYKDTLGSGVIFLTSTFEDKNSYFVGVTKDLNEKGIKAGDLVKSINAVMNGRGGGKPDIAQGGAPTLDGVKEAIELIKSNL
jgi:alanyl-tRNA synthetase